MLPKPVWKGLGTLGVLLLIFALGYPQLAGWQRDVKLKKNSPLLIDFGALCEGYHSDMTRVVCLGRFPK